MKKIIAFSAICVALLLIFLSIGCVQQPNLPLNTTPAVVNILYTSGVGPMPQLLGTKQVDGYIAWQPFPEIAQETGIGKVAAYTKDFPPLGQWTNHPTNVFITRNDFYKNNPDIVNALTALTILSDQYITSHPDEAANITAQWLVGGGNFTYGNISVDSNSVMKNAIRTVTYTTDPSPAWINGTEKFVTSEVQLGYLNGTLKSATPDQYDNILFDFSSYQSATDMIKNGGIKVPQGENKTFNMGYLLAADHAALFVAVKDSDYFNKTYGIALVPQDPTAARPNLVDLIVNGTKVATINLVPGDAGPQLMQLAATNAIQTSYVGVPPAIAAIDKGTPIKILSPVDTEGSALVVVADAPVTDWNSFIVWAKQRAAAGNPLKIAAPGKGSIQDVMLQSALKESGISVNQAS